MLELASAGQAGLPSAVTSIAMALDKIDRLAKMHRTVGSHHQHVDRCNCQALADWHCGIKGLCHVQMMRRDAVLCSHASPALDPWRLSGIVLDGLAVHVVIRNTLTHPEGLFT